MLHAELTQRILKAYFQVYNTLGYGFPERVYENAMVVALNDLGHQCTQQSKIEVYYQGAAVGNYRADPIVEDRVIVEVRAAESLCVEHDVQLINYLKATQYEIGLLLNFGKQPEFRRKIFTNARKKHRGRHPAQNRIRGAS